MNSYTKITLILLLSALTTLIHTAEKSDKEMAEHHKEIANYASKTGEMSLTWGVTNIWFEALYRDLDKKGHVPENWQFFRRINKPLIGLAGVVLVGASSAWFYHTSLAEHHKTKSIEAERIEAERIEAKRLKEESKKWFWQK